MVCDLCGKDAPLISALVEGTELNVCNACGKHGKVLQKPVQRTNRTVQQEQVVEQVVDNYSSLVRGAREKRGMTQKEFAQFLKEKESIIHKIESNAFTPSLALARKMERTLGIKLVEIAAEGEYKKGPASGALTIGDLMKTPKS